MNNWENFKFFLTLARYPSLKRASKVLNTNQTTVGRRVTTLEKELGVKLFQKHSDGFFLTHHGRLILEEVEAVEMNMHSISRKILGADDRICGTFKIASPGALVNHFLIPKLGGFLKRHPTLTLQFLTGSEVVNLAKREADIAVRLVRPVQKELLVSSLGKISLGFYAQSEFAHKYGQTFIKKVNGSIPFIELEDSACSSLERELRKSVLPLFNSVIKTRAWTSVLSAIKSGIGVGILPSFIVSKQQGLKHLSQLPSETTTLYLVSHPDLKSNKAIQSIIQEIKNLWKDSERVEV